MAKKRIAVLGGGMGSLVAVFDLTARPGWADDYEITVYQTGWRLGGKGASGRNPKIYDRIEEHGLHVMFGFYDNVFRVMKQAYDELGRNPSQPLATWQDAFKPHDLIVMMEKVGEKYLPWPVSPPRNDLVPGVPAAFAGPWEYVVKLLLHALERFHLFTKKAGTRVLNATLDLDVDLETLREQLRALVAADTPAAPRADAPAEHHGLLDAIESALWHAVKSVLTGQPRDVAPEMTYLDIAHALARRLPKDATQHHPKDHGVLQWLLRRFRHWLWKHVDELETDLRRLRLEIDFGLTVCVGMLADGLVIPPVNWFKADGKDFRVWLRDHGAHPSTVDSPITWGLYDAIFSTDAPVGAGTIVHLLLCMGFDYKGAVNWKMQAGMGDTIFTPLYQVLKRRGVKFEFFHCVNQLHLDGARKQVERIDMGVQATLADGVREYDPLYPVKGLDCWPSTPRFEQLAQGQELERRGIDLEDWWTPWPDVGQKTLQRGRDFDLVLLGISVGAFPYVCKQLMEDAGNPRFKAMVDGIATCQTAALQLWLAPELAQTGWPEQLPDPIVIPYVEPLDTWADMSQLIVRETWPPSLPVGNVAYLCSNMTDTEWPLPPRSDHGYPGRQAERCKQISIKWLKQNVHWLWPKAAQPATPDTLNWWWLVDPERRDGVARFDSQYWHAPNSPSERYVLVVPGSSWVRLRADESGYDNLVLAGDWTLTSVSAGCLEAATMSGIMAANAIDGAGRPIYNDWLPPRGSIAPAGAAATLTPTPPRPERTPMAPAASPAYIQRDGQLMATPPIKMDTLVYMFTLDADMDKLRAMCDRYLNLDGDGSGRTVWRPLVPWVMLYCSTAKSAPTRDPIGWCPELDFGFWVPVVAGRVDGAAFFPERLSVFTPYLWVDSGVAMVGGREVYGFPKQLGQMSMPKTTSDPPRFSVDCQVIPVYGPESQVVERPMLRVERVGGGVWEELKQLWADGETIVRAIEEMLAQHGPGRIPVPDGKLLLQLLRELGRELPMVFLKQFPAAGPDDRACYQRLVEAPIAITSGISGGWIPGEYGITIHSYDSHRIVENLGLRTVGKNGDAWQLRSLFHGWTKFDAMVKGGTVDR